MLKGRVVNRNFDRSRIQDNDFNLNIKFSKLKNRESRLSKTYDIKKYLNSDEFYFPEEMDELIPKNTPLYLDNGENYVERIAREIGRAHV